MNKNNFIVVDIETAGPSPHQYAMLSIGASTITNPKETFYIELVPDFSDFTKEAMKVNGLDIEKLEQTGVHPSQGMQEFAKWISQVVQEPFQPIFTAFNAPFDWMFVNTYFHKYLGYNPFGHKALDIKALFMGVHKVDFPDTSHFKICQFYGLETNLSHHALEDAIQEAQLLEIILNEI